MSAADAIRRIGVSQAPCYRWGKPYVGMKTTQLTRL
jgi:hypothetical protein